MRTKHIVVGIFVIGIAVAILFGISIWIKNLNKNTEEFKKPKILFAHLDGMPVERLPAGWKLRPIAVMKDTSARLTCQVVPSYLGRKYWIEVKGIKIKAKDCDFLVPIKWDAGTTDKIVIHYDFKTKDGQWKTDTLDVPFTVIPHKTFVAVHAIEDIDHKHVDGPYAPTQGIYVYAKAAIPVMPTKDLIALFFVEDPLNPGPMLQINIHNGNITPIGYNIRQYRWYGQKLYGIALWNTEPVVVGPKEANHAVYNIYVGVFPKKKEKEIVKQAIHIVHGDHGKIIVQGKIRSIKELKPYAIGLSKAWRLIRGKAAHIKFPVKSVH